MNLVISNAIRYTLNSSPPLCVPVYQPSLVKSRDAVCKHFFKNIFRYFHALAFAGINGCRAKNTPFFIFLYIIRNSRWKYYFPFSNIPIVFQPNVDGHYRLFFTELEIHSRNKKSRSHISTVINIYAYHSAEIMTPAFGNSPMVDPGAQ